jgi:hypothetical protein
MALLHTQAHFPGRELRTLVHVLPARTHRLNTAASASRCSSSRTPALLQGGRALAQPLPSPVMDLGAAAGGCAPSTPALPERPPIGCCCRCSRSSVRRMMVRPLAIASMLPVAASSRRVCFNHEVGRISPANHGYTTALEVLTWRAHQRETEPWQACVLAPARVVIIQGHTTRAYKLKDFQKRSECMSEKLC